MKFQQRNRVVHDIWAWTSLAINSLIMFSSIALVKSDYKIFIYGCIVFIFIGAKAFLKISRDISLNDLSEAALIMTYVGVMSLSCMIAYITYIESHWIGAVSVLIAIIVECIIAFVIVRRYSIRNKKKKSPKKRKQ